MSGEDEKFLGELLIASLPDSKEVTEGALKGKAPLRNERMRELGARMPEKFNNPLSHERALGMLVTAGDPLPAVEKSLAAWAANQSYGTISVIEDQSLRQRRGFLLTEHLKRRLAGGDLQSVREAMVQIAGASSAQRSSYNVRDAARPLVTLWQDQSPALISGSDPAVRKAAREIWREFALARDPQNVLDGLSPARALRTLLYDAMDDDVAGFSAAAAELPEPTRKKLKRSRRGRVSHCGCCKTPWPGSWRCREKRGPCAPSSTAAGSCATTAWRLRTPS
jgi:hypothetical protein